MVLIRICRIESRRREGGVDLQVVVHEGKGDELDNDDVRSIRTIMLYELEQVDAKEEGQIERQQQQAV